MIRLTSTTSQISDGIKCLIYGKSGVGKTPLLITAPGMCLISAEKGLLSVQRMRATACIVINSYPEMIEVMTWCYQSQEAKQFYTFGLDSVSEIAELVLAKELSINKDPRKAYGNLATEMIKLAKYFRDIPTKNTVLIAKEEYDKDETTGVTLYQPQFPGQKLGPAMPYYFDETLRMVEINGQRALATKLNFQQFARDRSGNLAEYEPPDLTHVFRKILGV